MACPGSPIADDYCWLPDEFPEEEFFVGVEEEVEHSKESDGACLPRGPTTAAAAAAAVAEHNRRGSSGMGPVPLSPSFPTEFPYDVDSSLSPSPLGSAAGTDSDDDEYGELVAGLAQQMMGRSFRLQAEVEEAGACWPHSAFAGGETLKMSGGMRQYSPQSTLSPAAVGGRSPTDPDYLLLASRKREESALDLLSAAALEVERMRAREGAELRRALAGGILPGHYCRKNITSAGTAPAAAGLCKPAVAAAAPSGFYSNPPQTHQPLHPLQSNQPPPQHRAVPPPPGAAWGVGPRPRPNRGTTHGSGFSAAYSRPPGSPSPYACPPSTWSLPPGQQPLGGSGMRAVFLGGTGTRRESSGTGVFLPRRDGNPPASKKKPGCSTVLLPARVVQALNLNLDEIGALPVSHGAGFVLNSEVIMARNRTIQTTQQQQQQRILQNNATAATTIHRYPNRQSNPQPHLLSTATKPPAPAIPQEIRLPPEWSY